MKIIKPNIPGALLFLLAGAGCLSASAEQTRPLAMEPLFTLNPTDSSDLSAQTRIFRTSDQLELLAASTSVLQDMGFKITGGHRDFGLLVGEKTADVASAGVGHAIAEAALVTTTLLLSVLVGQDIVSDLPEQVSQRIHVSLHLQLLPEREPSRSQIRISIDRDMFYDDGRAVPDHMELPAVYEEFFGKLARAIYLEGEQL